MATKKEAEDLFELIGKDAQAWLAQARQHKLAADALLPNLKEALSLPPVLPGVQEKRFAFVHSYMLLMGFAFENLIKGVLIGRDPKFVNREKLTSPISDRGGHGITAKVEDLTKLKADELKLLQRIEEYLFWAGRYPLPLRSGIYLNSEAQKLRSFCTTDPAIIDALFDKLSAVLLAEWASREEARLN